MMGNYRYVIKLSICKPIRGDFLPVIYFIIVEENVIKTVFKEIYRFTEISNPTKCHSFLYRDQHPQIMFFNYTI